MTFAKLAPDRRPPRRAALHRVHDTRRAGALVLSLPQHGARVQPAQPAWSSLTIKAATTLSYCAGPALPALLLGLLSWMVAEILAGCAAYAEAMYAPPVPQLAGRVPADPEATEASWSGKPNLSLMAIQADAGSAGSINQASHGVRPEASPAARGERPVPRADWRIFLVRAVRVCWSSLRRMQERRRAIEELRGLDDLTLRDIGIARYDIEHVVKYGVRRE